MESRFSNVYADRARAEAYATLEFPGTYFLAYRDLPAIIGEHVQGKRALDFGCGAGRSSRFLKKLGFDVVGVDISAPMLARARDRDPGGDYRLVSDADLIGFPAGSFDLILCAFTFDNIPTMEKKVAILEGLRKCLDPRGRIVNLVSAPEIYVNEWVSFSTKEYPENRAARCGDKVRIVMLDVDDRRPVEDILWTEDGYGEAYERAALRPIEIYKPLGKPGEPIPWTSETDIAPWVIHVLGPVQ
jgi:SAM-dependent methyltransferase